MKLKLKQMKMPMSKKASADEDMRKQMMEEESQESPEDEMAESPEQQKMEDEMGIEQHDEAGNKMEPSKLEAVSDDDLMAEIKKRGLLSQLEKGEEEAYDADSESNPENVS